MSSSCLSRPPAHTPRPLRRRGAPKEKKDRWQSIDSREATVGIYWPSLGFGGGRHDGVTGRSSGRFAAPPCLDANRSSPDTKTCSSTSCAALARCPFGVQHPADQTFALVQSYRNCDNLFPLYESFVGCCNNSKSRKTWKTTSTGTARSSRPSPTRR